MRKYIFGVGAFAIAIGAMAFIGNKKASVKKEEHKQSTYYWFNVDASANPTTYDGNHVTKAVEMGPTHSNCNDLSQIRCRNGYLAEKVNFVNGTPVSVKSSGGSFLPPDETIQTTPIP